MRRVLDAYDELTDLDRKVGDGDFGVNMEAALGDFTLPLKGTVEGVLDAIGQSFLVRAGGTSGAVFGLFFARMGAAAGNAKSMSDVDVGAAARAGLDAIVELGGAKVGDGTVVDAIEPAGKGRASYVGEASKGIADPGALVMAWFFEELAG